MRRIDPINLRIMTSCTSREACQRLAAALRAGAPSSFARGEPAGREFGQAS